MLIDKSQVVERESILAGSGIDSRTTVPVGVTVMTGSWGPGVIF